MPVFYGRWPRTNSAHDAPQTRRSRPLQTGRPRCRRTQKDVSGAPAVASPLPCCWGFSHVHYRQASRALLAPFGSDSGAKNLPRFQSFGEKVTPTQVFPRDWSPPPAEVEILNTQQLNVEKGGYLQSINPGEAEFLRFCLPAFFFFLFFLWFSRDQKPKRKRRKKQTSFKRKRKTQKEKPRADSRALVKPTWHPRGGGGGRRAERTTETDCFPL